jgi:hypothetical protein
VLAFVYVVSTSIVDAWTGMAITATAAAAYANETRSYVPQLLPSVMTIAETLAAAMTMLVTAR